MNKIILIAGFAVAVLLTISKPGSALTQKTIKLSLNDTLPTTDTIGQGNWQHTLKSDSLRPANSWDSSRTMSRKNDSLRRPPNN